MSRSSTLMPQKRSRIALDRNLRKATILGSGACVPSRIIENDYFSQELGLDTTKEWIESRIGIRERRWAVDESTTDLAVGAAQSALDRAGLDASDIDVVIVATSSPDFSMPSTACLVQGRLGAENAFGLDVVNACSGFVYALDLATRYLQDGSLENALVIGVDRGSRLIDPTDRSAAVFFGDGAGAVVVSSCGSGRTLASAMHSRGTSVPLYAPVGGTVRMDGKAVWNFATEVLPSTMRELCDQAGIEVDDVDLLIPHQANRNILAAAANELGFPLDRVVMNIDRFGNTLAGSIPIALDETLLGGRAKPGDKVAMIGFGAGLAWGGILLEL
jgi:3-oxoacyl-[acyl-carrier-protein] synthase-3